MELEDEGVVFDVPSDVPRSDPLHSASEQGQVGTAPRRLGLRLEPRGTRLLPVSGTCPEMNTRDFRVVRFRTSFVFLEIHFC